MISELTRNAAKEHGQVVPLTVFVAVLCLCLLIGHLLEENRWVNESITAILIVITLCFYAVQRYGLSHNASSPNFLLPRMHFWNIYLGTEQREKLSHLKVKKKQFFQNFITIILFGVIGVFISTLIITIGCWWLFPRLGFVGLTARDYLAIGTIFSSTDTVCTLQVLSQDETPLLYSLVFGEGVVNDATSVVLFNAVQKMDVTRFNASQVLHVIGDFFYFFSTSTALGISSGLLTAYVLKRLYFGRHSSVREIAIMVLMAYLSYMLAELLELSGILTVFICGILMSHYAWHNVTESSRITTRHACICNDVLYSRNIHISLCGHGCSRHREMENDEVEVIVWWAGLMRGAVSIALAFKQFTYSGVTWDPVNATLVTNTIIVVLFTTLVFGFLTKPIINYLIPQPSNNHNKDQEPKSPKEDKTLPLLSLEESAATNILRAKDSLSSLVERPVYTIHYYWKKFDDAYMRPIFGGPMSNRSEC
ncbi:unnamed protein product [Dovyalis caffra]|uniref:Cation/H+ exchanger transmembrane domain-containing protein n=1 Tax=Dovyalis caffra TaxID=77055 RepID=A0AAV1QVI9_9ROSI|nr:unnamed protein product [Dovyalis caffra]